MYKVPSLKLPNTSSVRPGVLPPPELDELLKPRGLLLELDELLLELGAPALLDELLDPAELDDEPPGLEDELLEPPGEPLLELDEKPLELDELRPGAEELLDDEDGRPRELEDELLELGARLLLLLERGVVGREDELLEDVDEPQTGGCGNPHGWQGAGGYGG